MSAHTHLSRRMLISLHTSSSEGQLVPTAVVKERFCFVPEVVIGIHFSHAFVFLPCVFIFMTVCLGNAQK